MNIRISDLLYIAFLDAKPVFDVVCHNSLMRKLFHIGVDGVDWSLHEGAECGKMGGCCF